MDRDNIDALRVSGRRFEPTWSKEMRDELYARWLEAIERSRSWVKKD
jgi:glycerol kinase